MSANLDLSAGNALMPMDFAARHAFARAARDIHLYSAINMTSWADPIGKLHYDITRYFNERGMFDPHWGGLGTRGVQVMGGGTTEAFEHIMTLLQSDIDRRNEKGEDIRPVIVMPTPTYGFFATNAQRHGFEILRVPRDADNGWKLDLRKLHRAFGQAFREGKRVVAYYDSNPHNPTGLVRTKDETELIASIIEHWNRKLEERDWAWIKKTDARHIRRDDPIARIKIIDDMVYDGLEYDGAPKPFAFAQLRGHHQRMFHDTFTLFGTSKAGLVNLRAGLVIGDDTLMRDLMGIMRLTSYFPSMTSYYACEAYFSMNEKHVAQRAAHLKNLNAAHETRGLLMKALINGIDRVPEINAAKRQELIDLLVTETSRTAIAAEKLLARGVPHVRVITTPQSGFFHLLDFSRLRGRSWNDYYALSARSKKLDHPHHHRTRKIECGIDLEVFLEHRALRFAAGEWAEMERDGMINRATFALPVKDIVDMTDRLRHAMRFLAPLPRKAPVQTPVPALANP